MAHQIVKRAAAAVIAATTLVSGTAGASTTRSVPEAEACSAPVLDPMSRLYVELRIVEVPGATFGPVLPTCPADGPRTCYEPVIDPTSRAYTEARIAEMPWVEIGPELPTCPPDSAA